MKRMHKEKMKNLSRYFSLFFWNQCCICKDDFRRELGFKFITGPYYGGAGCNYYICRECAPTEEIAIDLIKNIRKYVNAKQIE